MTRRGAGSGKEKETIAQEDTDRQSSEPRRSGRDRRQWDPDVVFGGRRPSNSSPTQHSSPLDEPKTKPKSRTTKQKESLPQEEPRSLTPPRRSAREKRSWDPDRVYGNRLSEEHSQSLTANDSVSKKQLKPRPVEDTSRVQKSKEKARRRQPQAPVDGSPGEGQSRPRRAPEGADGVTQAKTRGRPKASDSQASQTKAQPPATRAPRRKRSPGDAQEPEQEAQEVSPKRRKRRAAPKQAEQEEAGQDSESESDDEQLLLPFRYLTESVRNIQPDVMNSKWDRLDAPSINAVADILAEAQRPVLLRLQTSNQRRAQASAALSHVSQRLVNKLGRGLPFPEPTIAPFARANSGSHMEDFDFERTVDMVQNLENMLDPLLHSVALLEREIRKEENALSKEYEALHQLESNARANAAEWRDKARREHDLVPDVGMKAENDIKSGTEKLELVPAVEGGVLEGIFKVRATDHLIAPIKSQDSDVLPQDLEDEELVGLSKQVGSHMESMKNNLQQIASVVPAIIRSKAALQQVLSENLKEEKYSDVLLGG